MIVFDALFLAAGVAIGAVCTFSLTCTALAMRISKIYGPTVGAVIGKILTAKHVDRYELQLLVNALIRR